MKRGRVCKNRRRWWRRSRQDWNFKFLKCLLLAFWDAAFTRSIYMSIYCVRCFSIISQCYCMQYFYLFENIYISLTLYRYYHTSKVGKSWSRKINSVKQNKTFVIKLYIRNQKSKTQLFKDLLNTLQIIYNLSIISVVRVICSTLMVAVKTHTIYR